MPEADRMVLRDVRVFDGTGLSEPRAVVIDGTLIGTDPTGAREIDGAGAALLPGLIDAHVHLVGPESLAALASWGVTTGLDLGFLPAERVAALRGTTGLADFRRAGLPAIGPDGPHARMPGMPKEAIVVSPDDARRHVAARAGEGVDYIKGIAEAPGQGGPSADALCALVAAAKEHGLKTIIHAASVGAYTLAVETGAEFVTHVPVLGTIAPEDIVAMRAAGQTAIPTIIMMAGIIAARAGNGSGEDLLRSLTNLHEAGVHIIAGTDANASPGSPNSVPHGESLHDEFTFMARAGMTPTEILRSATVLPARAFGLGDRGAVEPGLRADLLLVDGDPTVDISVTRAIRAVWCAGVEVVPATK